MSEDGFGLIADPAVLEQYLDTLQSLVDEAVIHFGEGGIRSIAADPASVGMVETTLAAEAFESYHGDGTALGFDLERFADFIGKAESGTPVEVAFDLETRKVDIDIGTASFKMAAIDPDSVRAEPEVPDLELPADVTLPAAAFAHGVDVVDMVSDYLRVVGNPDADAPMRFEGEGDTDTATVPFENALEPGSSVDAECESLFSLDYITDMDTPIPTDAEVRVEFGDEFPIIISYPFTEEQGHVTTVCAPRIPTQ